MIKLIRESICFSNCLDQNKQVSGDLWTGVYEIWDEIFGDFANLLEIRCLQISEDILYFGRRQFLLLISSRLNREFVFSKT